MLNVFVHCVKVQIGRKQRVQNCCKLVREPAVNMNRVKPESVWIIFAGQAMFESLVQKR